MTSSDQTEQQPTGSAGPPGAGSRQVQEPTAAQVDAAARRILTSAGDTWAVVGLSNNTARAAYGVAQVLRRFGKRVVPVHPSAETVQGEPGYASLAEVPFPVDVVDVFVNSSLAGQVADEAVGIGAKAVWFQLGVVDTRAYDRTVEAGVEMVMDRCPAIEIPRLG
ncbi:CoA-binding protein [Streptomyces sp. XM4193]|uniref:CoA-binding protein n=1 Tax=Streptomyces sp. XM4193 TaxID=2929782 RepID=UPI001FF9B731|nr:CoA-binding protein [Streptomyces sp. XM4193]MCK1798953.1 CoA-binding protein [Streptomyces sp. XM4193]